MECTLQNLTMRRIWVPFVVQSWDTMWNTRYAYICQFLVCSSTSLCMVILWSRQCDPSLLAKALYQNEPDVLLCGSAFEWWLYRKGRLAKKEGMSLENNMYYLIRIHNLNLSCSMKFLHSIQSKVYCDFTVDAAPLRTAPWDLFNTANNISFLTYSEI